MEIKSIINKKFRNVNTPYYLLLFFLLFTGCRKFIEVEAPYTSLNGDNVYTTDATAISAVTTMYVRLGGADGNPQNQIISVTYSAGLSSDELTLTPGASVILSDFYTNSLKATNPPQFWTNLYSLAYLANASIEGLTASKSLTPSVKQQLLGEAKFM